MTTDTFLLDTEFESLFKPLSGIFGFAGMTSNGFMKADGNHYRLAQESTYAAVALCVEKGNRVGVTNNQLVHDMTNFGIIDAEDYSSVRTIVAAPGTPYFYIFVSRALMDVTFQSAGVMYKVLNDQNIQPIGAFDFNTGINEFEIQTMYGGAVINNRLVCIGKVGLNRNPVIGTFSLSEDGVDPPSYQDAPLPDGFFDYIDVNRNSSNAATVVPLARGRVGVVIYVSQADYDAMQTIIFNDQWADITGPCVIWFLSTNGGWTDVSSRFDLSDRMKHLDGSASTNYNDDYVTPQAFMVSDRTYLMFSRSYTLPTDLEPTGTYVRAHIYLWDGESATSVFDETTSLFDPVVDCGVAESNRTLCYPDMVQGLYDPTDKVLRYCWHGASSSLDFDFVFGKWIDVEQGEVEVYGLTFAAIDNTSFTDWQTSDATGFGADFSSDLVTYYFYSDNQTMWMQSPYVFAYVSTHGRGTSGLLMTPEWDFSEASGTHKFARTTEVYRDTDQSLVSVTKNRVRGKGRALRFHWQSEQSKDFNLLGWSVSMDQNTKD